MNNMCSYPARGMTTGNDRSGRGDRRHVKQIPGGQVEGGETVLCAEIFRGGVVALRQAVDRIVRCGDDDDPSGGRDAWNGRQ